MVEQFMVLERILKFPRRQGGQHSGDSFFHVKNEPPHHFLLLWRIHPLVLEGTVLFQTKDKNPVYLFDHSQALAPLAQRFGTPDSRQFIQGAEMILYKDLQETAPQP